jgi:hypothetical protein
MTLTPVYLAQECLFACCKTCGPRKTLDECRLFKWTSAELGEPDSDGDANKDERLKSMRVSVQSYGPVPVMNKDTAKPLLDKNGKVVTRLGIVKTLMTAAQVAEHFRRLVLEVMPPHQFRALHQHEKFKEMKSPLGLPLGQCVVVMDFSQNAELLVAREVQQLHWTVKQVSLHIAVVYRHASKEMNDEVVSTAENPVIVKDIFSFVSDDGTHDTTFVHECQRLMYVEHYGRKGHKFTKANEWTDGCAGQYKCGDAFGDLAENWVKDFGFPVERNYFESCHAKGEQDGEGGTLKKAAADAVRADSSLTIQNAEQWVAYLSGWAERRLPDKRREYKHRHIIEIKPETLIQLRKSREVACSFEV